MKPLEAARFLDSLKSMGLSQHVTGQTHKDEHTLDLITINSFGRVISPKLVIDTYVSDHTSILCGIDCCKPAEFSSCKYFYSLYVLLILDLLLYCRYLWTL